MKMKMEIKNDEQLFEAIEKILSSVQAKTRNNPDAPAFLDIFTKLHKIQTHIELGEFSLDSKQECNLDGPLAHLYDGQHELSMLGESLCAINAYYQGAGIDTLSKDDASTFFQLTSSPK